MMKFHRFLFPHTFNRLGFTIILVFVVILLSTFTVAAQVEHTEHVNILDGSIFGSDNSKSYTLVNLLQDDKLYVHVQGTSGNLDPFVALLSSDQLTGVKTGEFDEEVEQAIKSNRDPLLVVTEFSNNNFLAWDDDSGEGFSSALEFTIPEDGIYHLVIISSPFSNSFGDYQLMVGLNAPQVLHGSAIIKGDPFVISTSLTDTKNAAVQEVTASVGEETSRTASPLAAF